MPKKPSREEALELRMLVQRFVRDWGLLDQDRTPCGHPVSASHAHALMFILERGRDELPAHKALAQELGIDKSSVARLCQRMEAAGHVEQERSAADARARHLRLTDKGLKLATEIQRSSHSRFADLCAGIPPARRAQLLSALKLLTEAAKELRDL